MKSAYVYYKYKIINLFELKFLYPMSTFVNKIIYEVSRIYELMQSYMIFPNFRPKVISVSIKMHYW